MNNQHTLWNSIAPEWHEFKTKPSQQVLDFLKKQKGNILDLGSGSGRHLTKIKGTKMFLVDFSEEMIKFAKQELKEINSNRGDLIVSPRHSGVGEEDGGGSQISENIKADFKVANLTKIPYKKNFFDSAICISSLHCIKGEKNRIKVIQELYRVLKPKAQALLAVWDKNSRRFKNAKKEKLVAWRNKGKRYYYLYEEKELKNLLEKNNFKIKKRLEHSMMIIFLIEKN